MSTYASHLTPKCARISCPCFAAFCRVPPTSTARDWFRFLSHTTGEVWTSSTLRDLLEGIGESDGGAALQTPRDVIRRVGTCRVVVTGSYHGAVFALSQGIPVVAIVKSRYYLQKMAGVAHEFGTGCHIVNLDDDDVSTRLSEAISRAWAEADGVREPLLQSAVDQIRRGRSAYARLRDLVSPGPTTAAAELSYNV